MASRTYRAACPNCGAPVEFRSAASAFAVCAYCQSTIVRKGDALERIGKMAELFDDFSPLQLGSGGTVPAASAALLGLSGGFTVVGRMQYRYADGVWNEWHLLFDDQRTGWLSEDNGRFALTRELEAVPGLPADPQTLKPGRPLLLAGTLYRIASVTAATVVGAQGELPAGSMRQADSVTQRGASAGGATPGGAASSGAGAATPGGAPPAGAFWVVDTRGPNGRIATLDYSEPQRPRLYAGAAVSLPALNLQGLRDSTSEKTLAGNSFSCPHCGASVQVKLNSTQAVTCPACASVIDVSHGVAGDLANYQQALRYQSPIPLGTTGRFDDVDWQVTGFVVRSGVDEEGERFAWNELVLFNTVEGFAFIVIASDGVSFVRTVQGAPEAAGRSARFEDRTYTAQPAYTARVEYVEGEFYWQLKAGQSTRNVDYRHGGFVLSSEASQADDGSAELVWSAGRMVQAQALAKAFGLASVPTTLAVPSFAGRRPADILRSMAAAAGAAGAGGAAGATGGAPHGAMPTSASWSVKGIVILVIIILVVIFMLVDDDDGGSGAYGGSYSGTRHK
ncbi:MAG TPA: DUF4178 domain-containing protein [Burkholderiaceae bacterium]|nr:DUF4178 domain-containing protein [Burkholderiaceae bacterium]